MYLFEKDKEKVQENRHKIMLRVSSALPLLPQRRSKNNESKKQPRHIPPLLGVTPKQARVGNVNYGKLTTT